MSTGQALLIFAGIPIGFAALVAAVVFVAGWTRGRGTEGAEDAVDGPLLVVSGAAVPDPGAISNELPQMSGAVAGGGAHGEW